jgi:hypothetical protein
MRRISPVFVKQQCHLDWRESAGFPAPGFTRAVMRPVGSVNVDGTVVILPCGCTLHQKIARGSPARATDGFSLQLTPNRVCLGLFAAAEAFGLKFVHGSVPHIYLERLDREALAQLGMSVEDAERRPDAIVRAPENPESVFRAAVCRDEVLISDILQVWLDVSNHPARGPDQAKIIARKVLAKLFSQGRA